MKRLLIAASVFFTSITYANCPQFYPDNASIKLEGTVELCNSFFVTQYNTSNKAVIFSSELLKRGTAVGSPNRINAFRADARLGKLSPVNLDYVKSTYDRGHMAAADNAATDAQMRDTFLLSNMTPQSPKLNQVSWKKLETDIRKAFLRDNIDYYIVTVAIYNKPTFIGNNIPVPSGYWKFIFSAHGEQAFYAPNVPNAEVRKMPGVDYKQILANAQKF